MTITSKDIKKELKEMLNINQKQVSVSVKNSGYADTYVKVSVKDIAINLKAVEDCLARFEKINRDLDYEILQGCNVFVMVSYDREIYKRAISLKMAEANEIMKNHKTEGNNVECVKEKSDCLLLVCKNTNRISIRKGTDTAKKFVFDNYSMAEALVAFDQLAS